VASAGDVNGDGYGDILIGAYGYSNIQSQEGRVYLFYGSSSGLSVSPAWSKESNVANAFFGFSVAGAGDINGDGYSDIVVGAYGESSSAGAAYIFKGSSAGLLTAPATIVTGLSGGNNFGYSVAGAGDVNGDGFCDIVIGAYAASSFAGAAYIFHGSITGLSTSPAIALNGLSMGDRFGYSVAGTGDINGDGYGDVIVGAIGVSSFRGATYFFPGSNTGLPASPATILNGINTNDRFGYCVASAGDINGDGYSDVVIGAQLGSSSKGAAYIFPGAGTGISSSPATILSGITAGDQFGVSVASTGDINSDGYSDIIVGAIGVTSFSGAAYGYYGNSNSGIRNNLRLYNSDTTTPIQQSNMSDPNLFGAGLYAKSFIGRQKGKMVWETVRNGNPFSGSPSPITNSTLFTAQQVSLRDLGLAGFELKDRIAKRFRPKQLI
jgi:hypothetical protein